MIKKNYQSKSSSGYNSHNKSYGENYPKIEFLKAQLIKEYEQMALLTLKGQTKMLDDVLVEITNKKEIKYMRAKINMVMKTIFTALQKKIELLEENSQETFNLSEVEFHGFRLVYDEWCIPKNRKPLKKERLKKPHQTKQNKRSNYNKDTNKNKRRFK